MPPINLEYSNLLTEKCEEFGLKINYINCSYIGLEPDIELWPTNSASQYSFGRHLYGLVEGCWELKKGKEFTDLYPGSELIVKVTLSEMWQNCPRYIHRYQRVSTSKNIPDSDGNFPLANWKRIDGVQDVISEEEKKLAEKAGLITAEAWMEKIKIGADDAA